MINLKTFSDERGRLTPIDKELPFSIKRLYYINDITNHANRGGHSHVESIEAIFCVHGSCTVVVNDGKKIVEYPLTNPAQCVIVEPGDWHMIHNFSKDAVLMGVSSTYYDHSDYYYDEPKIQQ